MLWGRNPFRWRGLRGAGVLITLCRPFVIVEGDARRHDVNEREAAMSERRFQNGHKLFFIAGKTARHKCRANAESQQNRIDRRHAIGFTAFTLGTDIGGRRELTFSEPIHAVILNQVNHLHVAANA